MSEFKPTPQTAVDLERAIIELKAKKSLIVNSKILLQNDLSNKKRERDKLNPHSEEANEITLARVPMKERAAKYEQEIIEFNNTIANKRLLLLEVQNYLKANDTSVDDKRMAKIATLRDKYSAFAGDHTRISSMRIMAAKVRDELEAILKL